MKTTVSFYDFCDAFKGSGRKDSFSYEALGALFEHLEEMEESCDQEMELDIVAIDCEYCEYGTIDDIRESYPECPEEDDGDDSEALEWLSDRTTVLSFPGGYVLQNF